MENSLSKIRLLSARSAGQDAVVLTFEPVAGKIVFVGGQYIIGNSGIKNPEGKILKRAYTISSSDSEPEKIRLLVYKKGAVSGHLAAAKPGDEFEYSGPWGKAVAHEKWPLDGAVILAASHSGISAVSSLMLAARFKDRDFTACWFTDNPGDARQILAALGLPDKSVDVYDIPVNDITVSVEKASSVISALASGRLPGSAFLAGEEALINGMKSSVVLAGIQPDGIVTEKYFVAAEKKMQEETV